MRILSYILVINRFWQITGGDVTLGRPFVKQVNSPQWHYVYLDMLWHYVYYSSYLWSQLLVSFLALKILRCIYKCQLTCGMPIIKQINNTHHISINQKLHMKYEVLENMNIRKCHCLPSADKINFGKLLIEKALRVFWYIHWLNFGEFTLICQIHQSFHSPKFSILWWALAEGPAT